MPLLAQTCHMRGDNTSVTCCGACSEIAYWPISGLFGKATRQHEAGVPTQTVRIRTHPGDQSCLPILEWSALDDLTGSAEFTGQLPRYCARHVKQNVDPRPPKNIRLGSTASDRLQLGSPLLACRLRIAAIVVTVESLVCRYACYE